MFYAPFEAGRARWQILAACATETSRTRWTLYCRNISLPRSQAVSFSADVGKLSLCCFNVKLSAKKVRYLKSKRQYICCLEAARASSLHATKALETDTIYNGACEGCRISIAAGGYQTAAAATPLTGLISCLQAFPFK